MQKLYKRAAASTRALEDMQTQARLLPHAAHQAWKKSQHMKFQDIIL